MVTLVVKENRAGPVIGRHPWVFSQALVALPDGIPSGEPVRLVSEKGGFLAQGYFNSYSQIAVRLWGYEQGERIETAFFGKRVEQAYRLRKRLVESPSTNAYRLINGENDLLPGLIVDKYGDYLVLQFHTKGIERWKTEIVAALEEKICPMGIYERSDVAVRAIDGLGPREGILSGAVPDVITIAENGLRFLVDVKKGQKTGFFLDQRDKREAFMRYTGGASVLNCFSYTGGFTVYALAGGARRVVSVDTSESALELARSNVELNGMDSAKCAFVCEDVKRYLRRSNESFDAIVLDPPAFIKDRRKKADGVAGYKSINEAALRLLPETGVLVTCSCSAHLSAGDFRYLLSEVGSRVGRPLRILESFTHGIDHVQLVPFLEGQYLKCFILTG